MELQFDQAQLNAALTAAILTALEGEAKDRLIKQAIEHLVSPQRNGIHGRESASPLVDAMNTAVHRITVKLLDEDPEVVAAIRTAIIPLIGQMVLDAGSNKWQVKETVSRAIADKIFQETTD